MEPRIALPAGRLTDSLVMVCHNGYRLEPFHEGSVRVTLNASPPRRRTRPRGTEDRPPPTANFRHDLEVVAMICTHRC